MIPSHLTILWHPSLCPIKHFYVTWSENREMMKMKRYFQSVKYSFYIMLVCVFIELINSLFQLNLNQFGILPRSTDHLSGIIFSPFLHGSWQHLMSNFMAFIVLGGLIGLQSTTRLLWVFSTQVVITGSLVWLFARGGAVHIGMSGVIYSFWGLLLIYGVVRRHFIHLLISIIVFIVYGGLIYGVLPNQPSISFESHLLGAISGGVMGYYLAMFDLKSSNHL